jgi:hypothetical protein
VAREVEIGSLAHLHTVAGCRLPACTS